MMLFRWCVVVDSGDLFEISLISCFGYCLCDSGYSCVLELLVRIIGRMFGRLGLGIG